jgi:exoribonuclease R
MTQYFYTRMTQYFSTGELPEDEWRHYALAMTHYTHFTSPIRRYPDIVVHRLLQAAIWRVPAPACASAGGVESGNRAGDEGQREQGAGLVEAPLWDSSQVKQHAAHCNDMKWASKAAQEASTALFLRVYLERHPLERQDAIVTSLGSFSFTVFVPSIAQEFKVGHKSFTIPPTWTSPNKARQAQSPLEVSCPPCLPLRSRCPVSLACPPCCAALVCGEGWWRSWNQCAGGVPRCQLGRRLLGAAC